jgi:hypothetical protein
MIRRLLNLLTLLSLLLCVAVAVLWVRSCFRSDIVRFGPGSGRLYRGASGGGGVMLQSLEMFHRHGDWRDVRNRPPAALSNYTEARQNYAESRRNADGRAGRWEHEVRPYTGRQSLASVAWAPVERPFLPALLPVGLKRRATYDNATYVAVEEWFVGRAVWLPYWLPAALLATPAAFWLRRAVRTRRGDRRRRMHQCPSCGYDLRATPGRCPECGHTAATNA